MAEAPTRIVHGCCGCSCHVCENGHQSGVQVHTADCIERFEAELYGSRREVEVPRLTKEQAAIIGAYTGVTVGPFDDIKEYAERKLGRQLWTHEMGTDAFEQELREAAREDFLAVVHDG